jgi:hypothetical protein
MEQLSSYPVRVSSGFEKAALTESCRTMLVSQVDIAIRVSGYYTQARREDGYGILQLLY